MDNEPIFYGTETKLRVPKLFPEAWVSVWGEDEYGLRTGFTYKGNKYGMRWIGQHGFWCGTNPVTPALWYAGMGTDMPAQLTKADAEAFIQKMSNERDDLHFELPSAPALRLALLEEVGFVFSSSDYECGENQGLKEYKTDQNKNYNKPESILENATPDEVIHTFQQLYQSVTREETDFLERIKSQQNFVNRAALVALAMRDEATKEQDPNTPIKAFRISRMRGTDGGSAWEYWKS